MSARDRWQWTDRAACADPALKLHPDVFFPPATGEKTDRSREDVERAREVCRGCAVKDTCFAFPFRDDRGHRAKEEGVWGAATPENRDATRRELANRARRDKAREKTEG